jgi:tetratricopeptide (TPR) repeat protein
MTPARRIVPWLVSLLVLTLAAAQGLAPEAEEALAEARAATDAAIAADAPAYPEQPLWAAAIDAAQRAVDLAPDDARTLGLLAETYARAGFYGPSWTTWTRFLDAGHGLTPEWTPLFLEVGEELAWSSYERGDLDRAAEIHLDVLDTVPFSKESRVWVARIRMEQGRPLDALPYWEAVVAQDPDDARARYFLGLAEDQVRWGIEAADAFRAGVAAYEQGDLDAARRALERATRANDAYAEAWAWRGRIAYEAESWLAAERLYARAVELAPGNETYRWFQEASRRALEAEEAAEAAAAAEAAEAQEGGEATESDGDDSSPDAP